MPRLPILSLLDALNLFRIRFGGRPLLLTAVVLAVLLILQRTLLRGENTSWRTLSFRILGVAGLLGVVSYIAVAAWYASDPHFFDNAEPSVVALGWLYHVGKPVYHTVDSAERYAHIYGPMLFMFHGWALGLFGASIEVSKWLSAGAGMLSLVFLYGSIRRHATPLRALAIAGMCALLMLLFRNYSFWVRPEPLQLVTVAAALFLSGRGGLLSAALTGLVSGVLWNLKFTGPLYSLPTFVLLYSRTRWSGVLVAGVVGISVAAFPFVMLPNVSLTEYVTWLNLSSGTGLVLSTLRENLEWAAYFCLPLLIACFVVPRDHFSHGATWSAATGALLLGILGVAVAGSKPGAGPYHLIPFLPTIAYLVAWRTARVSAVESRDPVAPLATIAFVVTAVAVGAAEQAHLVRTMAPRRSHAEIQDVERFASTHRGIIEMGYGGPEALSHERPVLVFRSGSYLVDEPAIREHQLQGLSIPPATIEAISGCRAEYWLIPKGEVPFDGRNSYPAALLKPMFSDAFRQAFSGAYVRVDATNYFDVWQCLHRTTP